MTDNQQKFCDEYLKDCNGARAYKVAYPRVKKDSVARACASKLLTKANIKEYIDEELEKMHSERIADATEVAEYLTSVLRGESKSEIVIVEGLGSGSSRATRIYKTPDERERLKAAELLGKRYGIFTDKVDFEGSVPVIITGEDDLT